MEQVRLPNPKEEEYSMVAMNVELGKEYKITIYETGIYIATIEEVSGSSIVVSGLKPQGNTPAVTLYTIHNKDKAIFPTEEIYDIESI